MSELKVNRRTFLKAMAASGVAATMLPVLAKPQVSLAANEPSKAVYLYATGPMGNMGWQKGDTAKFLPAATIPDGKDTEEFIKLPKAKLLELYRRMHVNWKFETKLRDLNLEGKEALGSGHMYIGEEAIANGVMASLNDDDYIASTHRGHGHLAAKGAKIDKMMAEFFAKTTGYNGGFGGSMHMTDMSLGILGMNGIVGAGWFIAAGAGLGIKVKGEKKVAVAFAGDGATNSVFFFNAVRSAANFKLPAIFVVENNFFMISVPSAVTTPTKQICDYVKGLGIPSVTVDGNDIVAVWAAGKAAVENARAGNGPSVIEAMTFRWYDHSGFAGAKIGQDGALGLPYRTDDEVKQWITRAPWVRYAELLTRKKIATADELKAIETKVQAETEAAVEFAKQGAYPKADAGLGNVWKLGPVAPRQFVDGVVSAEFKVKATDNDEFKRIVRLHEQTAVMS